MSKRWPGGIVSGTGPTITSPLDGEGGSAPGVWSMEQAQNLNAAGTWPKPLLAGQLWSWGNNNYGRLGQNSVTYRSSPVQVGSEYVFAPFTVKTDFGLFAGAKAITNSGELWVWGYNSTGQLGQNDTLYRTVPVQVPGTWSFSASEQGGQFSAAIKTDGTLWTWGQNTNGKLGQNNTVSRSSPVQVGSGTTWSKVYLGISWGTAIKTDGTMWTWGDNRYGQLGQNNVTYRSSPVQVGSLTNWLSAAAGEYHTTAIKTDGTLWTWGRNNRGQLGQNNATDISSPVQVGSGTTWSKVSSGTNHILAIKTDGTLWAWGHDANGRLGLNTAGQYVYKSSPVQVGVLTNWSYVAGHSASSLAIKTDGTLWSWGENSNATLGHNDTVSRSSPVQVGTGTTWASVSAVQASGYGVKTDGTLWAWGYNGTGGLAQGDTVARSSPVQVGSRNGGYPAISNNWSKTSSIYNASYAIKTDGTLWSWGRNRWGELGLGNAWQDSTVTTYRSSPTQIGSLTNWASLATGLGSGYGHMIAIKTDGTLWSWGDNRSGQLGQNNITNRSSPVQIGTGTTWASAALSTDGFSFAIKTDGSLWAWGANQNTYRYLGDGTNVYRSSPVQVGNGTSDWSKVACGRFHIIAIKTNGTIWGWSKNTNGELGLNDTQYRQSPSQIGALTNWLNVAAGAYFTLAVKTNGTLWAWGTNAWGQQGQGDSGNNTAGTGRSSPTQIGALTNWLNVAAGQYFSSAIKTDGTIWAWGNNGSGQFGQGNIIYRSSPVQVGTSTWSSLSTGYAHVLAIKTDGTLSTWGYNSSGQLGSNVGASQSLPAQIGYYALWNKLSIDYCCFGIKTDGSLWSWGNNYYGQLGQNNVTYRSSPVQVGSLYDWRSVSAVKDSFVIATKTDGTLWTWGSNNLGQLGQNDAVHRSSPVQVGVLTTWLSSACGYNHAIATKTDGTLWAWGYNNSGQLGQNNVIYGSSPVQVGALTNWSKVFADNDWCLAIKTDGTLWAWGSNENGKLGDVSSVIGRSSPVQIGSLTNWSSISMNNGHALATKTDGTLWAWGYNQYGHLGQNDTDPRSSPVQIGSGTTWSRIAAGRDISFAIKTDGTLWAWGYYAYGTLGLNDNTTNISSPVQIGSMTNWSRVAAGAYTAMAIRT